MAVKIVTLNVNGIVEHGKRQRIFDYLKLLNADIYALQETHIELISEKQQWTNEWGGPARWSLGTHHSRGVGILFNPQKNINIISDTTDTAGRVISTRVHVDDTELNIMSIYAPTRPEQRKDFYQSLWRYLPGTLNLILCGDFNCVPDTLLDKCGGNPGIGSTGMQELNTFLHTNSLIDIWRLQHPTDRVYTWNNRDFSIRSRLDRCYIPDELTQTGHAHIRACPHSDHSAAEVTINPPTQRKRGPGLWKLNVTVLQDPLYKDEMTSFLNYWPIRQSSFTNLLEWWDEGKRRIKTITIKHSVRLSRRRKRQELDLLRELTRLKSEPAPDNDAIRNTELQLRDIADAKARGTQIRSRAQWLEHGEKPSRYFFQLERRKQAKTTITKLNKDNTALTDDQDILAHAQAYYQTLYNAEQCDVDAQNWFLSKIECRLSNQERESAEGPITAEELDKALDNLNLNKAPGADGLPAEFYKTFWPLLRVHIRELFNTCYDLETLSDSQTNATLKLLYKKDDKHDLKNWRPISLLNSDYKLLATVLAARVKALLPSLIHQDQTCGIPGRTIFENLFRLRDLTHDATLNQSNLILINLDQEKAFDKVDHSFLLRTLHAMNVGPSLSHWITVLYTNANCKITNNGWLSQPVALNRGVRQGCPLSPLLYVIVAENLANAIRQDTNIIGARIPGTTEPSKISQYADDGTLTVTDDLSVVQSFDVINQYERASGSKLNLDKTEGIYIGRYAGRATGPVPIKWRQDTISVLGTKIGNNMNQNWDKVADKVDQHLDRWKQRKLTVIGKALIIRTFALATVMYLASVFVIPERIITRIHRAMFSFLWDNKNERISRATCHLPWSRGGLNIPDLHHANCTSKTKWIQMITDRLYNSTWTGFARYWLGTALSTMKPEWTWLRDLRKPHADPKNTPAWYQITKDTAQQFRDDIASAQTITSKVLNEWLQREGSPPRAERLWRREIQQDLDFRTIWNNLWASLGDNTLKDLMWKVLHQVLTTKTYLASWGMNLNKSCPFCVRQETPEHCLLRCHRVDDLWQLVMGLLTSISGQATHLSMELCLKYNTGNSAEHIVCQYLIQLAFHVIWSTRNKHVLNAQQPQANLVQLFKGRLRQRIEYDATHHPNHVEHYWTLNNVLCHRQMDTLIFNF